MPTTLETIVPGTSYNSSTHTWTIPASSLAAAASISWVSPVDSASALIYMLLQSTYTWGSSSNYNADNDLFSTSNRNISTYGWGSSSTGIDSTIITFTHSVPFTQQVGEISPDSLGEN